MLTEKDKTNLFKEKKCCVVRFFYKRKIMKGLDTLINQADEILKKYPEVDFNNAIETAYLLGSRLLFEEQKWNLTVETYLAEIFHSSISDLQKELNKAIAPDAISDYAKTRWRIVEKQKILIAFRADLIKL